MAKRATASTATAPQFDRDHLRKLAGDKVYARGVAYHANGQVEIVTIEPNRVVAEVTGSEVYRSELNGSGEHFSGGCSCPAFSDWGFCKHLVATALAANAVDAGVLAQQSSRENRLREYLRGKTVDQLVDMIMGIAERESDLRRELELAALEVSADDKTLLKELTRAITRGVRTNRYISYGEADDWAQHVHAVLDRIECLIAVGRAPLVLELLPHFFACMDETVPEMVDDSDGQSGSLYGRACEIRVAATREVNPDPVTLARDLFAREVETECDHFAGASETYADVLGPAGLKEYRRLAEAAWQTVKPRAPGRARSEDEHAGLRDRLFPIVDSFAEEDGDIDRRVALRAANLCSAYDYLALAQFCEKQGRTAAAVTWAEEGLWKFEDAPDDRLVFFTVDLYRRVDRPADAEKLLWQEFERKPSRETYDRLKAAVGTGRGAKAAARDRAFAFLRGQIKQPRRPSVWNWLRPVDILLELMIKERLFADAWALVGEYECRDDLRHSLAEASEDGHPREALGVHVERVERLLQFGSHYEEACALIARIQALRERLGERAQHATYVADLALRYKRRRNFIKLLRPDALLKGAPAA